MREILLKFIIFIFSFLLGYIFVEFNHVELFKEKNKFYYELIIEELEERVKRLEEKT